MPRAKFSVAVSDEDRLAFAELSGDHNPLHVDAAYAAKTESKQCVLHGAFRDGRTRKHVVGDGGCTKP